MANKKVMFKVLKKGDIGRQDVFRSVDIDFSDRFKIRQAIRQAEKKKRRLENQGYVPVKTEQVGVYKFRSFYVKKGKKHLRNIT